MGNLDLFVPYRQKMVIAPCGVRLIEERLAMASLRVFTVPCLSDNYAWLIQDIPSGNLAVVDTPAARPIIGKMRELGVPAGTSPVILNTHHHKDHTGGNLMLKEELGAFVVGPKNEHISGIDRAVGEGDIVRIGSSACRVIDIPGHTKGHVGYVFDDPGIAFVGDTMFSHGCGALFEGSFRQMWKSLSKIMDLPPSTLVFCAHEYTEANLNFAMAAFKDDPEIQQVHAMVRDMRSRNEQTIPSLLEQELRTNPFLRCRLPEVQATFGKSNAVDAFTHVREGKDLWGRGGSL
jgi:hydroxyacylglutathione hydrolase